MSEVIDKNHEEISRRSFIKIATGIGVGAVLGVSTLPIESVVSENVDRTDLKTGNPAAYEKYDRIEKECSSEPDPGLCEADMEADSGFDKLIDATVIPAGEEFIFRFLPSNFLDQKGYITEGWRLSKPELLAGGTSSLFFAGIHNVTNERFSTKSFHLNAALIGMAYWYFQRKFGYPSNTTAHIAHNLAV